MRMICFALKILINLTIVRCLLLTNKIVDNNVTKHDLVNIIKDTRIITVSIQKNTHLTSFLKELFEMEATYYVRNIENNKQSVKSQLYILEIGSIVILKQAINLFRTCSSCWNPYTRILVILSNDLLLNNEIFHIVRYGVNIFNVIILQKNKFYRKSNNNIIVEVKESLWHSHNQFQNCSLKVTYVIREPYVIDDENIENSIGIEIKLLNTIANKLNLTIFYKRTKLSRGDITDDGNTTGLLKQLKNGKTDIILGGYGITNARLMHFDATKPYLYDKMQWCTKQILLIDRFYNIQQLINGRTVCLIILMVFIQIELIWLTTKLTKTESFHYKSYICCLLNNFAIIFGKIVHKLPKSQPTRLAIVLILLFSIMFGLVFQTYMQSVFSFGITFKKIPYC